MSTLGVTRAALPVESIRAVVGAGGRASLVISERAIQVLTGIADGNITLGAPVSLKLQQQPFTWSDEDGDQKAPRVAVEDIAENGPVYLATFTAVLRMDKHGAVEVVAGSLSEAAPVATRLDRPTCLAADGEGSLFLLDGPASRIVRLTLSPTAAAATAATVLKLAGPAAPAGPYTSLTLDPSTGALFVSTETAVLRVADPYGGAYGRGECDAAAEVVAGSAGGERGCVDQAGPAARFTHISHTVLDEHGTLFVLDSAEGAGRGVSLRRVDTRHGYGVSTLPAALGEMWHPAAAVLPGGVLCLYERGGNRVRAISMGLALPKPCGARARAAAAAAAAAAAGASGAPGGGAHATASSSAGASSASGAGGGGGGGDAGGLGADWGALLGGSPWEAPDVTVHAGGRPFRAHRLVLGTRCPFFRRWFSVSPQVRDLNLEDADARAFEQLLRYMYTGALDFPADLLPAVQQLSERLLLERVGAHLAPRMPPPAVAVPEAQAAGPGGAGAMPSPSAPCAPPDLQQQQQQQAASHYPLGLDPPGNPYAAAAASAASSAYPAQGAGASPYPAPAASAAAPYPPAANTPPTNAPYPAPAGSGSSGAYPSGSSPYPQPGAPSSSSPYPQPGATGAAPYPQQQAALSTTAPYPGAPQPSAAPTTAPYPPSAAPAASAYPQPSAGYPGAAGAPSPYQTHAAQSSLQAPASTAPYPAPGAPPGSSNPYSAAPQGGGAGYPGLAPTSSVPYPPPQGSGGAPYPGAPAPYPTGAPGQPGSGAYPQHPGQGQGPYASSSPYAPAAQGAAGYPPPGGAPPAGYPAPPGAAPYAQPGGNPPPSYLGDLLNSNSSYPPPAGYPPLGSASSYKPYGGY